VGTMVNGVDQKRVVSAMARKEDDKTKLKTFENPIMLGDVG